MFSRNKNKPQSRIDTLIGVESSIDGNITFNGGLRVDGKIKGNVTEADASACTLVLSEHGSVEGAITVSHAVLNGKINGPVRASHYLELQSKSRIIGDVHYQTLEMHTGAVIEGKLVYLGEANEPNLQDNKTLED
ncbi:polymer-forming cytoskeletal protein [Methylovorus menthalis]|uniref:bactofilin family protein n=1 Tax=Methylovorus menthalis TaxID=1002227 RepID=UPI001E506A15|nr:polymer-forming cytoskeletal protein [Methylovorus menthalis]MCB4810178.1 polymer-forming cytoskeletal protein [Methylovorus menthalis]